MYARQRPCKTCGQAGSSPALLASRGRRAPISSRHRAAQPPPRPAGRARPVPPPPRPAPTAAAPRGARRRACAPQRGARRCRRGVGRAPRGTPRSRDPRLPVHGAGARWKDRPRVRLAVRRIKSPAGVGAPCRGAVWCFQCTGRQRPVAATNPEYGALDHQGTKSVSRAAVRRGTASPRVHAFKNAVAAGSSCAPLWSTIDHPVWSPPRTNG